MRPVIEHAWQLTPTEAVVLQNELRQRVERVDRLAAIRHVAGVDVGFEAGGSVTRAAVALGAFRSTIQRSGKDSWPFAGLVSLVFHSTNWRSVATCIPSSWVRTRPTPLTLIS